MSDTERRVLVVDDDGAVRQFISEVLISEGFQVTDAWDTESAQAAFERTQPDLVLLDIRIPGDGIVFISQLLSEQVPLLVISGVADVQHIARDLGAQAFLRKPFDVDRLIHLAKTLCRPNNQEST